MYFRLFSAKTGHSGQSVPGRATVCLRAFGRVWGGEGQEISPDENPAGQFGGTAGDGRPFDRLRASEEGRKFFVFPVIFGQNRPLSAIFEILGGLMAALYF